jgi:hypothetical protein
MIDINNDIHVLEADASFSTTAKSFVMRWNHQQKSEEQV